MTMLYHVLLGTWCILVGSSAETCSNTLDGCKKVAFGASSPPSTHIPVVKNGISTKEFFNSYVNKHEAVLFKGAIKESPATKLWNDEYFKQLSNIPDDHTVLIESRKKEDRKVQPVHMPFKEFVAVYNHTDQYMVEPVPSFLKKDYMVPHHLQCDQLMEQLIVETFMWFSSGGTSSVVHTDSVENMNCLVAGRKKFVFVPPQYAKLVPIDHPNGAYSSIDVDDVDFEKYPGVADIKFMHAELQAGDCLYIPYKWIHQVRSYDRNIAVNIWWDTFKNSKLDLDRCNSEFHPDWTLDRAHLGGFEELESSTPMIRDHVTSIIRENEPLQFKDFYPQLGLAALTDENFIGTVIFDKIISVLQQAFNEIDGNRDGLLTAEEAKAVSDEAWENITGFLEGATNAIDKLTELTEELAEQLDVPPAPERDEL